MRRRIFVLSLLLLGLGGGGAHAHAMLSSASPAVGGSVGAAPRQVKSLAPGTYQVHWRALSVDTHTTQGSFSFHVGGR